MGLHSERGCAPFKSKILSAASVVVFVATAAPTGAAQETGEEDTESRRLQVVTVTAEKREESAQDVPIAISAFDQSLLDEKGSTDILSIVNQVPSLQINVPQGVVRITLRGAGNDSVSTGSDNAVAFHYDGVYFGNAAGSLADVWDVQRVEVLRGPQGTLFGRNTTGGSINVIPQTPTDEFEAFGDLTFGNYSLVQARGVLNVPLGDSAAGRLAFVRSTRDGYLENAFPGVPDKLDDDSFLIRGQLAFDVTPQLDARLGLVWSEADDLNTQPVRRGPDYPSFAGGFTPFYNALYATAEPKDADPYKTRQNFEGLNFNRVFGATAHVDWDLGPVTFRSITGHFDINRKVNSDWDDSELSLLHLSTQDNSSQFTQEFQLLSGPEMPFEWIVGATYFDFENDNNVFVDIGEIENLPGPFFGTDIFQTIVSTVEVESWAVFGQATFPLSERVSLTTGLRWSSDEKESFTDFHPPVGPPPAPGAPPSVPPPGFSIQFPASFSGEEPTGKIGIDFDVDEDRKLYANYSRGYRAGAVNPSDPNTPTADPEFVNSYEIGLKSFWFDQSVEFNAALFLAQYEDIQINTFPTSSAVLVNVPGGDVFGLELDGKFLLTEHLRIDGSLGLFNSEYDGFTTGNPARPGPGGTLMQEDIGGNRFIGTPDTAIALGANYTVPLDSGDLNFRIDTAYRSETNFDIFNNEDLTLDDYTKTDLRASYDTASGRWGVSVWVQNLEDEAVETTIVRPGGALGSDVPLAWYAPPQTYGVTLKVRY